MEEKRSGTGWFLLIILLTAIILLVAWLYTGWQSSQRVLPQTVSMGGLPMGGMTREQAINALANAYASPITIYYQDEPILLVPEMVDLILDIEATAANLDEVLSTRAGVQGFINYLMSDVLQRESQEQAVQPILSYSRERLDAFLERTAQQYNHPPLDAVPLPEAGTFRAPQPGSTLDIEASRPLLIATLLSPIQTEMQLVIETEPAPPATMAILQQAIEGQLAGFNGVAGIFIKDLGTGRELCYNCRTPFSGLSTLKIAAALALYQQLDAPPDSQTATAIQTALTGEESASTTALFTQLGQGDPYAGAQAVTNFLNGLGLQNTFMAAPYEREEGVEIPAVTTPANTQPAFETEPDPYIQTTPVEMGLLLEALEQCTSGGGPLRLLYPQALTPAECEDTLTLLERNTVTPQLEAQMPSGVQVAHKHGWTGATHAEVALVYGPRTPFVLSAYLYQPEWLIGDESAPTFATIGQLVYRFLNEGEQVTPQEIE